MESDLLLSDCSPTKDLTNSPPTHKPREHKKDRPRLSKNNLREDYKRLGEGDQLSFFLRPPDHLPTFFFGLNEIPVVKLASYEPT